MVLVDPDPTDPDYVPPNGFVLGDPFTYYKTTTTATFTGPVTVCLTYPPTSFPAGVSPHIFHYVGRWDDIKTRTDTGARVVCGTVTSLSPFALGYTLNRGPLVLKRLKLSNPTNAHGGTAKDS